jgi:hypothetical protein
MRTKRLILTFQRPFSLKGVDRELAPGKYEVVTDGELIEGLSFPVDRRVATPIFLPVDARRSRTEMVPSIPPIWPKLTLATAPLVQEPEGSRVETGNLSD